MQKYQNIEALKKRRLDLGLSQHALAVRADVTIHVVKKLEEQGEANPAKFALICDALGLRPDFFYPEELQGTDYDGALIEGEA